MGFLIIQKKFFFEEWKYTENIIMKFNSTYSFCDQTVGILYQIKYKKVLIILMINNRLYICFYKAQAKNRLI